MNAVLAYEKKLYFTGKKDYLTLGSTAAVYADTSSQMPTSSQTTQISETTADSSAALTAKAATKATKATKKALTSKQVLKKLKKSLGKSYTSDTREHLILKQTTTASWRGKSTGQ